jgi:DnaK suppressor protein
MNQCLANVVPEARVAQIVARQLHDLSRMQMTTTKTRKIRDELDARRRELLLRYHQTLDRADEEQADHSPEIIDTANDQWDVRMLDRMSNGDARALSKVVEALHRLEVGTYGVCVKCERKITSGRLSALPEADHCTECAAEAEHH